MSKKEGLSILREYREYADLKVLKEDSAIDGSQDMFIVGPFLQGNVKNRNSRMYPTKMISESVDKYIETKIKKNRAMGELNHPPGIEINLDRVSHVVVDLHMEGNNGIGKAKLLDTAKGQIAKSLINGGCNLGVSTRGLGKLDENKNGEKIVSDYELVAIDIVADPSAPDAYVEAVFEGLQYCIDNDQITVMNNPTNVKLLENINKTLEDLKNNLTVLPKKTDDKNEKLFEAIQKVLSALK